MNKKWYACLGAILVLIAMFSISVYAKPKKKDLQESYIQYIKYKYPSATSYLLIDLNRDSVMECIVIHDVDYRSEKISVLGFAKKKVICMYDSIPGGDGIRFNKKKKQLCFTDFHGATIYQYTILKINKKNAKVVHSYAKSMVYTLNRGSTYIYYKSSNTMQYYWMKKVKITKKKFKKVEKSLLKWKDITRSPKWEKI